MKHNEIVDRLVAEAEHESNVLGFLIFGSVADGTQRADSDIDVITILQASRPASGLNNTMIDGIKVGDLFLTHEILIHSIETVPYLLHPLVGAKLLFDREGSIAPLLERIRVYFDEHPEVVKRWQGYYQQLKEEKAQFGYEKTTIIDVWNALEKHYSGGKTRRRFFNAFYISRPRIFAVLKRVLQAVG